MPTSLIPEVEEALGKLFALYEPLKRDANAGWLALQDATDTMSTRRAAVRATFAFVEGTTFGLKQLLLSLQGSNGVAFPPEEVAALSDSRYEVDDQGRARRQKARFGVATNTLFAFTIAWRLLRAERVDTKSTEWSEFKKAIEIRNRITHPKRAEDLSISDLELAVANRSYVWFHNTLASVFKGASVPAQKATVLTFPTPQS